MNRTNETGSERKSERRKEFTIANAAQAMAVATPLAWAFGYFALRFAYRPLGISPAEVGWSPQAAFGPLLLPAIVYGGILVGSFAVHIRILESGWSRNPPKFWIAHLGSWIPSLVVAGLVAGKLASFGLEVREGQSADGSWWEPVPITALCVELLDEADREVYAPPVQLHPTIDSPALAESAEVHPLLILGKNDGTWVFWDPGLQRSLRLPSTSAIGSVDSELCDLAALDFRRCMGDERPCSTQGRWTESEMLFEIDAAATGGS